MRILDACCSSESMYAGNNKNIGDIYVSMDIRKGDFSYKNPKSVADVKVIIKPTVLADMRYLPFKSGSFAMIICDPPHMDVSLSSFWSKSYGSWSQSEGNEIMKMANNEFNRCLIPTGSIIIKLMPDMVERFKRLLSNFVFFLPIQTVRSRGCMPLPTEEAKKAAIWLIGIKK